MLGYKIWIRPKQNLNKGSSLLQTWNDMSFIKISRVRLSSLHFAKSRYLSIFIILRCRQDLDHVVIDINIIEQLIKVFLW